METFTLPFQLATDFINRTNRTIFLTGRAGTGKTTFLRQIKEQTHKQTAIVAPTGVAAINAGGSTIHSFFQLPFNPYLPEKNGDLATHAIRGKSDLIGRLKMTSMRRKILQELELLIIDEISMVRCDMLDAIDVILRHYRYRPNEPFGGVQLLLIGDMFQLSPVTVEHEWRELSRYYQSPYFFHSRVMMQEPPVYIELDKIFRQRNEQFIHLLNEVRNNSLSEAGLALLKERYRPSFIPDKEENYIILSTHNYIADKVNAEELALLPGESVFFEALIKGEYPEKSYPIEKDLVLKVGAKVMFIKNDLNKEKRYFNGKIGTVEQIGDDFIQIQCPGDEDPIRVGKYIWENVRYEVNPQTKQMDERVIGTFQQFPLRLAWAITIHKSQGLTFEKAIIDAGKAFAPGQVYVALSRCTSLDGLVLKSPINIHSLNSDAHIVLHSKSKPSMKENELNLDQEKIRYQQQILFGLFNFNDCIGQLEGLLQYVETSPNSFNAETVPYLNNICNLVKTLQITAQKFHSQLQNIFKNAELLNVQLQNRLAAACPYFNEEIAKILSLLNQSPAITDSKIHAQTYNDELKNSFSGLAQKQHILNGIRELFSVDTYFKVKNGFITPNFTVNAYAASSTTDSHVTESLYPDLLRRLRNLRNEICAAKDLPVFIVAGSTTLLELSNFLPLTLEDMGKISGFGPAKIKTYGQRFLDVISEYCAENKLETRMQEKLSKKQKKEPKAKEIKPDTKSISFGYYKEGKTIAEIATIRNFTAGTILGHLAHYVVKGELDMLEFVNPEKVKLIENALVNYTGEGLNPLKEQLGEEISYDELRLVVNCWKARQHTTELVSKA